MCACYSNQDTVFLSDPDRYQRAAADNVHVILLGSRSKMEDFLSSDQLTFWHVPGL